jgi:hypothetical protein
LAGGFAAPEEANQRRPYGIWLSSLSWKVDPYCVVTPAWVEKLTPQNQLELQRKTGKDSFLLTPNKFTFL